MDRRSFLKGSLAGGALALGSLSLGGCSTSGGGGSSASSAAHPQASATGGVTGYMCNEDWLGEAPKIPENKITQTIQADVVVCGSGNAGIQAALAAAEKGAKVTVLEKQPFAVEELAMYGEDIGHFNSQWLIDQGFGPYNTGDIVTEFCKRGGNRVSPEIIRLFVENSGEMFDNFFKLIPADSPILSRGDKGELAVHVAYGRKPSDYPITQAGYKTWAGCAHFWGPYHDEPSNGVGSFSNLGKAQSFSIKRAQELGAEWHMGMEVVVCTQADDGTVTGVIAKKADSEEYTKFEAKAVILATGDFGGNPQMVWQLVTEVPEWCARQGVEKDSVKGFTDNTGAGHKMGCWAGGYIEPGPRATMSMGGGGGGPWGTAPFLWLNAEGKRFMNEGVTVGAYAATLRQPLGPVVTVTDSKWLKTVQNASIDHGAPNYARPQYYEDLVSDMAKVVDGKEKGGQVRSCCIVERMPAQVFGAADLGTALEYAGYTGAAKEQALASIKRYNELCYAGQDSDFGKDKIHMVPIDEAPFYVAPARPNEAITGVGLVTLAGLMTNDKLVVIRPDYSEVKGLYAAGNCLGQRYGNAYSTPTAGVSIGMAMTHGRLAGKFAADYAKA